MRIFNGRSAQVLLVLLLGIMSGLPACKLGGGVQNPENANPPAVAKETIPITNGDNILGADGALSFLIPQGYYDGSKTATAVDDDLLASNIASGVDIFGVIGTADLETHSNCTANGQSWCIANASYLAGAPAPANYNAPNGTRLILVPQGYYDGTKTLTAIDANLIASNLISTATIFGVTGSVTACSGSNQSGCISSATFPTQSTPATPATVAQVLTGQQFYAGGAMQTGTMANNGAPTITPTTADQAITAGYYSGGTVKGDADLLAANILTGKNIFGVDGTVTAAYSSCSDDILNVGQCSTAANRYVTATAGVNVLGEEGLISGGIPAGYYDGTEIITAQDADLVAANIRVGKNIFGVNGSVTPAYSACSDEILNVGQCSTAANRYVTATAGANVSGAAGSLSMTIPQGYYDGTKTATASDADLIAANIISTANIFGVAGSITACSGSNQSGCISSATFPTQSTPATPATVAQVLTGQQFYAGGAMQTGTMANRGNWNANTTAWPGAGYFSGLTSTLATSNVCTGTQIFGSNGAAICQSGTTANPAGAANILSDLEAWDATGAKLTGTMSNRGTLDASVTFPGSGYYSGINNVPTAAQIASGVNVLGVTGTMEVGAHGKYTGSRQHRDKTTTQVTLYSEGFTNAGSLYTNVTPYGGSTGYRAIPDINKDDDGFSGGNVTYVSRTGWTNSCDAAGIPGGALACKCGLSGTIAQRIANCAAHGVIGSEATWDGTTKGNAGQGVWKLVTRTGNNSINKGREVWQDQRTGLLWSSLLSKNALNWCKASGSNNISGNPVAQEDPIGLCGNATHDALHQNNTGQAVSACFEDDGTYFTQTDAALDMGGKADLNRTSTPSVGWRLPSRYDYQEADINGLRFVMPDMASIGTNEWTSTIYASDRTYAWIYYSYTGFLTSDRSRDLLYGVRCVGR